jgi:hypothetical protein
VLFAGYPVTADLSTRIGMRETAQPKTERPGREAADGAARPECFIGCVAVIGLLATQHFIGAAICRDRFPGRLLCSLAAGAQRRVLSPFQRIAGLCP